MKLVVALCLRSLRSMGIVAGKGSFVVRKIERPEEAARTSALSFGPFSNLFPSLDQLVELSINIR